MRRSAVRLLCGVVTAAMLQATACARLRPTVRDTPVIVLPQGGDDPAPFENAVRRRLAGVSTFRASGVIQVTRAGSPVRQANFLMLSGPDGQVRLRGSRMIGPVLFELIARAGQFVFTIPTQRRAYAGDRNEEDASADLLTPRDVTDPLRVQLAPDGVRLLVRDTEGVALLELATSDLPNGDDLAQRIEFSDTGHVSRVTTYGGDGPTVISTFGDYRVLPDLGVDDAFPYLVTVAQPQAGVEVRLQFREVIPNVEVPAAAFDPTPPPGFSVSPAAEFDADGLIPDIPEDS